MQVNITDRQDEILDRVNNLISAHRDDEYSTKFNNDEIRGGFSSLVLYQKSHFELEQNWSVAELRIGNDIYEALRNWFLNESLYQYFNSIINKTDPNPSILLRELEDFWLLFFIFECEHLRRSATNNDEVWQTLFEALRYSVFKSLFNKEGHATEKHRKIIKDVVFKNRMRNTFTDSSNQAWFNTFYLQIGFPRGGIKNLRLWVSRHNLTRSQELLLDTRSEEFSSNFEQLYSHLENIRYDTYDQSSLEFLEGCPWILKDWRKDIFEILSKNKTCTHFDHEINYKTRIIWDSSYDSKPSICLDFSYNSSSQNSLDNSRIFFKCHNEQGWLNKTDNYKRKLFFPFSDLSPVLVVSLYSENGEMILEKDILLWNEEDDISLFDDKGNRINNLFKSNPRLQYAIIANDLKIEPCNTLRERGSEFDLIKIDGKYDYNIYLDDILAWSSNKVSLERIQTASKNLNRVYLKPDYSKSNRNDYKLFVDHAPNINVNNVVIFDHTYYTDEIKREDRSEFSSIRTRELGHEKVKISYDFQNNKFIHRETVVIPKKGVLINKRGDKKWQRFNYNDHLTLDDLEKLPFKIIPPENQNSELFFMQGNRILYKYPDKVLKGIRKCFGYGSRLILRENPINAIRESSDVPISLCIMDTGIIKGIENNRGTSIHLVISTPPSEHHKIFCILNDATIQCFNPELVSDSSGNWLVCVKYIDLSCVLVTFKDKVSGSFWIKENYLKPLEATAQYNNQNIQNILTYYRNLKAPILFSTQETNSNDIFMGIMKNNFVQVISGLLSLNETFKLHESILKASMQINEDEGWLSAIREKLWFFKFDMLEGVDRIYMALKEILTSIKLKPKQLPTFICLFEVAPFLATFFLKKELLKNKNETEGIASFILSHFEGKLNEINEAEFDNDLSRTLSLDEGFIEDTIQKVYKINKNYLNQDKILNHNSLCREDEMLERNLQYLLEFDSFRYKLIVKLLT